MSGLLNGRPPGAVRREVAAAEASRPIRNVSLREMVEAMSSCKDDETFRWFTISYVNARGEPTCSETLRVTMEEARKAVGL